MPKYLQKQGYTAKTPTLWWDWCHNKENGLEATLRASEGMCKMKLKTAAEVGCKTCETCVYRKIGESFGYPSFDKCLVHLISVSHPDPKDSHKEYSAACAYHTSVEEE